MYLILCLWLIVLTKCSVIADTLVNTTFGPVRGFIAHSTDGKDAEIFLGIPFARPPVGELRFERPMQLDNWTETLNATEFKPACYPHHLSAITDISLHSEDCLYLNIMVPAIKKSEGYPVMVWIHGGAFELGSAHSYNYQNITNNFVSRDIVFVTIQYRLGFLGFMSTGDDVMPGNLGLFDQTAALIFVKDNIAFFGGDPNRLFISGLSAGGASTSALTLSPYSRDLFVGSIQMSGSAFAFWSHNEMVTNSSLQLARELNCNTNDHKELKTCLKTKTIDEFFNAAQTMSSYLEGYKMIKYGPRFDNDFFPKDLETLIKEGPKKPSIIGVAEKEAILFTLLTTVSSFSHIYVLSEDYSSYNRDSLVNFIKTDLVTAKDFKKDVEEVQNKLINYFANETAGAGKDYRYWLEKYTQLITDVLMAMAPIKEAEIKIQNNWPIWLYVTDYYNPALYDENLPVKGAMHGNEEIYLFANFVVKFFEFNDDDKKYQNALVESFANFVKQSNPSTSYFTWESATKENPRRSLRFRPQPIMNNTMFDEDYTFWNSLENFSYNIITGKVNNSASRSRNWGFNFCILALLILRFPFVST